MDTRGIPQCRPTSEYVLGVAGEGTVPHPLLSILFQRVSEVKVRCRPDLAAPVRGRCG